MNETIKGSTPKIKVPRRMVNIVLTSSILGWLTITTKKEWRRIKLNFNFNFKSSKFKSMFAKIILVKFTIMNLIKKYRMRCLKIKTDIDFSNHIIEINDIIDKIHEKNIT